MKKSALLQRFLESDLPTIGESYFQDVIIELKKVLYTIACEDGRLWEVTVFKRGLFEDEKVSNLIIADNLEQAAKIFLFKLKSRLKQEEINDVIRNEFIIGQMGWSGIPEEELKDPLERDRYWPLYTRKQSVRSLLK